MMNIVLGIAVCVVSAFLRFKYRPEGSTASQLFFISFGAGIVQMFTVNSLSSFGSVCVMLLEFALCVFLILAYRAEGVKQFNARRERSKARRREAAKAIEFQATMSAPRSRSSVIALMECHDKLAA